MNDASTTKIVSRRDLPKPGLSRLGEMSDAEIETAALSDPDAQPWTESQFRASRKVARIRTLRRALRLTQQQFADRYQIPLGTLRDWEQHRSEPDQAARAYLTVIAKHPDLVATALAPASAGSEPSLNTPSS